MSRINFSKLGAFALATCIFVSCVDEKYDLDNVDMTIGTSGDLTLPTSSTGEIMLKSIMDLEEDGIVQAIDGVYYLVEDGKANVPEIDISPITIPSPTLSQIRTTIEVDVDAADSRSAAQASADMITISAYGYEVEIPNQTYRYTINDKDNVYYDLDVTSNTVPEKVVKLESVEFVDETTLDAKITINLDDEHSFVNKVHMDNLKISLPKGLHVSHAEFRHWTDKDDEPGEFEEDGKHEHRDEKAVEINNEEGWILLTRQDVNTIIGKNNEGKDHEIDVMISFDRAVTDNEGFTFTPGKEGQRGQVGLKGLFKIDGTFRLEAKDFELNENTITLAMIQKLVQTNNFDAIRPTYISVNGDAFFDGDINVASFTGQVKSDVGDIAPIVLDNMPDFLNDPEVRLDLANPAIFIEVNNPLPGEGKTEITLRSKYSDAETIERKAPIVIYPNKHVVYCLAENPDAVTDIPAQYAGLEMELVQVDGLGDLLEVLPEKILVDVEDVVMDIKDLNVPSTYEMGVSYQVYTPIEFGENFRLVYSGTEEGIGADLEDINKMDTKGIRIEANAVTNIPMNLTLSVDALDRNNVSLKGKVISVNDIVINAHTGEGAASTQPISLTILPKEGHTIREMLEKMDKFHYRAVADADANDVLKESASIRLTNIKITLLGGIAYDAN
jgi:hypothetical protein